MKKVIDEIIKWTTLAAFIAAAVTFYLYKNSVDANTEAVTKLTENQGKVLQWMKDHNTRHEDHADLHEAERGN